MNKKYIAYITGLAVVLVVVGLFYWNKEKDIATGTDTIIKYKDPQLTEDQKKRFTDEVVKYQKELDELPKNASKEDKYQRHLSIATNYFPLGEYEKSRLAYLEAGKLLPQYPLPWYGVATVELQMMDKTNALLHIEKAIQLDPANPEYWRFKFTLDEDLGIMSIEQLKEQYKIALIKTAGSVDILTVYAKFLSRHNDLAGSVQTWKRAIETNPAGRVLYEQEIKNLQDLLK